MEKSRRVTLCDPETLCPIKTNKKYPANYVNHPKWELLDPTPNIQKLFKDFNKKYFEGKIKDVTVVWGKLLDEAGVTIFIERSRRRDYDCRIVLSAPLLRLRPRADLINTLLHEMIHAYLFVTFNEKDRAEHGPEFKKHMRRLNKAAGTAITIYHDFHDEVELYTKQHWWRCNGPCQKWRPDFGLVRKMRNKPPGPSDYWWGEHKRKCGGTFIKVREPGDMDAKPVKMIIKRGQKKTRPRPRTCRRHGCTLAPKTDCQKFRNTSPCPACDEIVHLDHLNEHLDRCLETEHFKDCIVCGSSIILQDYDEHVISCVDRKFSDVQFKQCLACGCSIMMKDYEKHVSKCSDRDLTFYMDDNINDAFRKCIICDCSVASKDYEKHIDKCAELSKTPVGENNSNCDVCKQVLSPENYDYHVENCMPKLFEQNEEITNCIVCGMHILKEELHEHLEDCDSLLMIFENEKEIVEQEQNDDADQCVCPICIKIVLIEDMDIHIDQCIEK